MYWLKSYREMMGVLLNRNSVALVSRYHIWIFYTALFITYYKRKSGSYVWYYLLILILS
jgi:hypothetical protein